MQISHNVLVRAIRHAERHDLVARNVAALVRPPKGQREGRPSKALTLEQTIALMDAAKGTRLEAYIIVSLLAGLRTEEVRALHWDHVVAWVDGQWHPVAEVGFDHDQIAVFVWRSDRAGGATKTPKSRRTLALARRCVVALREQRVRHAEDRLAAGPLWQDHGLVFASSVGTPQNDHNVRRQFRNITEAAGLGDAWVPRDHVVADGHLWDALAHAYDVLGFGHAAGGDEVFRQLVLARIIEPVSKPGSLRVLEEIGITAPSYRTLLRRLPVVARDSWRQQVAAACAAHAGLERLEGTAALLRGFLG